MSIEEISKKADRANKIFKRLSPHQMAALIVDMQDAHQAMIEQRNGIGLAIDKAILNGELPEDHPMINRLTMLAGHHRREKELAAQLEDATKQIGNLAGLLQEAKVFVGDMAIRETMVLHLDGPAANLLKSIDSLLAGTNKAAHERLA